MAAKRSSSRVTRNDGPARPARPRRDRRKLMVQILAGVLVVAMLLPVLAVFL